MEYLLCISRCFLCAISFPQWQSVQAEGEHGPAVWGAGTAGATCGAWGFYFSRKEGDQGYVARIDGQFWKCPWRNISGMRVVVLSIAGWERYAAMTAGVVDMCRNFCSRNLI